MIVYTDLSGRIREASKEACELLGMSAAGLVDRMLPFFFVENREDIIQAMIAAGGGISLQVSAVLRVAQTRPRRVQVEIHRIGSVHQDLLEWVLVPLDTTPA